MLDTEHREVAGRLGKLLSEDIRTVQFHPDAEQYLVAEVNDEWIFRFIRDPADPAITAEKAFLPQFAGASPV